METSVKTLPKPELWKSDHTLVVFKQRPDAGALVRARETESSYTVQYYFSQVLNGKRIHVPSFPKMKVAMKIDWPVFLADMQKKQLHFDCLTFHVLPGKKTAVVSPILPDVESSVLSALSIIAAHDLYNRENIFKLKSSSRSGGNSTYLVKDWKNLVMDDLAFALNDYVKRSSVQI